ncbi:hypothetical protein PT974_06293 [Cladobotryum mycophilum]|uniref:Uncharacterized protein n=1 Tax=Cladobotryum mycophilum TaxID=491253 RepID=A0ABR0SMC1_9HYPO
MVFAVNINLHIQMVNVTALHVAYSMNSLTWPIIAVIDHLYEIGGFTQSSGSPFHVHLFSLTSGNS